ncbi:hotdog fold thioesterase [Kocuria sp.]|uniref:PaaI family thioesterase n=1 Tax=Kocuria sp. TaxID=1871328 RepID=UPI0028A10AEE|nr:hotdog fold thioesterase [Kocuria sp.]
MHADPNDMPAIRDMLHDILRNDPAPQHLGIQLADIDQGRVVMTMPIADHMANSHGMSHGGYLFTLADTALAYCCATAGTRVVTRNAEITFVAPAHSGETVTATATRRVSFGRNQICDVVLEAGGRVVAYFTGQGTTPPARRGTES